MSIIIICSIIVSLTIVAILGYALTSKRRVKGHALAFSKAISNFNEKCNPNHPMSNEEWEKYSSENFTAYENAKYASGSKLISFLVKDLANAHTLVDIYDHHQEYMQQAQNSHDQISYYEDNIEAFLKSKEKLFDNKHFIAHSEAEMFSKQNKPIQEAASYCMSNGLLSYLIHVTECKEIIDLSDNIEKDRDKHNKEFIKNELERCSTFFDTVLSYPLDSQQREAIVNGEDNCLVVSSAGSGKTSTINGKVRYLIEECSIDPEDILLITYTRKAAEELRNRIGYGNLQASTFHALAYDIISKVDVRPTICKKDLTLNLFYSLLDNKSFIEAITYYLVNLLSRVKDPDKYISEREYIADRRKYGIQAYFPDMDGNIIFTRSEEERKICHFLSTHNVDFRYEQKYEFVTADHDHSQYKPDFTIYFTENGFNRHIYLEHFAVDKRSNVPKWFGQSQGKKWEDANRKYNEDIRWKRNLHQEKGTVLIETTSAMFSDGSWREKLTSQLIANGVPVVEKTAEEIYHEIVERDRHKEKAVHDLIVSFIHLLKANCKTINELIEQAKKINDGRGLFIIDKMIKPFFEAYQKTLKLRGEIDFTDTILKATEYCNSAAFKQWFKYIIVDEFQDISIDRYKLLMAIRSQYPLGKIFAVGDDWQSIYRFTGSDMGLFAEFPKYFGFTTQCKIESTYRFAEPTIKVSSEFIQKNKSQVKKNVKSPRQDAVTLISFKGYSDDNLLAETVAASIKDIPEDQSIYILSRYFFDFFIFKGHYPLKEDEKTAEVTIGNRKVKCLTVHQAKGLEADHIFLLKCNSDIYGFPSMISDDPVLEYLLSQHEDSIEYAEERRVFYVAITRAKLSTTIYYRKDNPSVFVDEISKDLEEDNLKKCPVCSYGHLKVVKQSIATNGRYYVTIACTNNLGGCNYLVNKFFDTEPSEEEIRCLIEKPAPNNKIKAVKKIVIPSRTKEF